MAYRSPDPRANAAVRVVIVTNIPAPYRVPIYNSLAEDSSLALSVVYCAEREANRTWDIPPITHSHVFLKGTAFQWRADRFIHNNPDVFRVLRRLDPDVVVTTGYTPTHLYAFAYARLYRRRHVVMTDGTLLSEADITWMHRVLRRLIVARSHAYIAASKVGRALLRKYGAQEHAIYDSPLCANTQVEWQLPGVVRDFDLLFSGRLVNVKNPFFALDVARAVARRLSRRVRIAMLGAGPLETALRRRAAEVAQEIDVEVPGNVMQAQIPVWFSRARVFLFPTLWDPWGVVSNEACMAGLPIIASPHAGASGELIRDGVNGYVIPIDLERWSAAASSLLSDPGLYDRFSAQARLLVRPYSFENAARGIRDAVLRAVA